MGDLNNMHLNVAALTGGANVPSSRFRWQQYVKDIEDAGISCKELTAKFGSYAPSGTVKRVYWFLGASFNGVFRAIQSRKYDVVFLQRNLIATLKTAEYLLRDPYILDVDDAIFVSQRFGCVDKIAKKARVIVCGNNYLAEYFARFSRVEIVPTAVDTTRFVPCINGNADAPVIGWSGSSSGFSYLYSIEKALSRVLDMFPDAVIKIVADKAPVFSILPSSRVVFQKWTPDSEVAAVQSFSVGLMPLHDSPWARGKCSYKMLTYMACGVPCVVSPVGMNVDILGKGCCGLSAVSHDDWVDAIAYIINSGSVADQMGAMGKFIVDNNYSRKIVSPEIIRIIRSSV
ncbi:glycosyltransferase family 4 protein [Leptothrix ochracea]|uniref:glycosyltransferase family 4 protein n=1 Tax=Leptothrix ochracea TaxID=735331 RepID=UPI0034E2FD6B